MARLVAPILLAVLALLALGCDGELPVEDAGPDAGVDAGRDAGPLVIVRPEEREDCAEINPLRNPYFGDLHVHTALSFDAAAHGVRTRPVDAYRYARGEEIGLPPYDGAGEPTRRIRLDRPLDFAAVTDHAEFLAETDICTDPGSPGYDSFTCTSYRGGDSSLPDYGEITAILVMPERQARVCRADPELCASRRRAVWEEVQDAAEVHYDRSADCRFTTFVAYEWTGSRSATNLHRNVIFRTASVPVEPVSFVDATTPEMLWRRLEHACVETGTPCDVLAIPHNGNLGAGRMFVPIDDGGERYDAEAAARRARLEPLLEIYQHKGASECVHGVLDPLASEDEACDFERLHGRYCTGSVDDPPDCTPVCGEGGGLGFLGGCVAPSDFARGALLAGLRERARIGVDPFQLGFIGGTDTHNSLAGEVGESGWPGHLGENEDDPEEQLRRPPGALIRGLTASPGGLAVIWAEENRREALFDALRRRETYATSGPRIVVRLFAGFDLDDDLCGRGDAIERADARGVPMGGELRASGDAGAPRFFVQAIRDSAGGPLSHVQIVKGWLEGEITRERVYEVAGDASAEASVDEATCERSGEGFGSLCAVWQDPDFDPTEPAFYYARVLETPSCRWSRYACNAAGVDCAVTADTDPLWACCDPGVDHVQRERAWTSPIWVLP